VRPPRRLRVRMRMKLGEGQIGHNSGPFPVDEPTPNTAWGRGMLRFPENP
jgi:hypothetical protein